MKRLLLISLALTGLLFSLVGAGFAQANLGNGPFYVVQSGDSLWDIAQRFHVSLDDLTQINNINNPNQISVGMQLTIPGLEGIQGELATQPVSYGETLRSLSRRYAVSADVLARLNHLSSPTELYAGYSLIIPARGQSEVKAERSVLAPGESLLELAVLHSANPWEIVLANQLPGIASALPGDTLFIPGEGSPEPGGLPGDIQAVEISPLPLLQGKAEVIKLSGAQVKDLHGWLGEHELHFFADGPGHYVALQGVHAMAAPGLYPLHIEGMLSDGGPFSFTQMVPLQEVDYPYDKPLTVDPTTIDPAVTQPEDQQWAALMAPVTPDRMWQGVFRIPSPLDQKYCLETNDCWSSRFGNRRSYNGSAYQYFHSGLDIVGKTGTEIYAPAAGVVVFTGPLTVRGNATVIDHGWGVYTAYMHQSSIKVKVGERVQAGQLIGLVGGTGRVQGPHLHWEVWVGGVQVDPLDWLKQAYP